MGRYNTGPGHFLSFLPEVLLYLKGRSPPEDFLEMTTFVICFCSFTLSYGVLNLFSYEMSFFGSYHLDNYITGGSVSLSPRYQGLTRGWWGGSDMAEGVIVTGQNTSIPPSSRTTRQTTLTAGKS